VLATEQQQQQQQQRSDLQLQTKLPACSGALQLARLPTKQLKQQQLKQQQLHSMRAGVVRLLSVTPSSMARQVHMLRAC
jgi:hypothetical protein